MSRPRLMNCPGTNGSARASSSSDISPGAQSRRRAILVSIHVTTRTRSTQPQRSALTLERLWAMDRLPMNDPAIDLTATEAPETPPSPANFAASVAGHPYAAFLESVAKPARYIGGEHGERRK